MAEKSQKTITIHEIDPDAMQQLVEYAYTGDMMITEDNVQARQPKITFPSKFEPLSASAFYFTADADTFIFRMDTDTRKVKGGIEIK